MTTNPIELKNIDSMPGIISINKRLKRPPSLSESFAWTPENIERANKIPLISSSEKLNIQEESQLTEIRYFKYEIKIVEVVIKLLLHITLISIFETLFYFLYVSSLEDNGIETTVNTFINDAANGCHNLNPNEIKIINEVLDPIINATDVIQSGNFEEQYRIRYNKNISTKAWGYVGGMMGIFVIALIYIRVRRIKIMWKSVILENVGMVSLLALYELMFFNTIIYLYHPISTAEIGRNAILKLQGSCGILE